MFYLLKTKCNISQPITSLIFLFSILLFNNNILAEALSISGRVTDSKTGQGISEISLILEDTVQKKISWQAITDAKGYYQFNAISPGKYSLYVVASKYEIVSPLSVEVLPGENIENLNIVMKKQGKLHLKPLWILFFVAIFILLLLNFLKTKAASSFFATLAVAFLIIGTYLEDNFYEYIADGVGIVIMAIAMGFWCREYRIKSEKKEQEFALLNKLIFEKKKKEDIDSD